VVRKSKRTKRSERAPAIGSRELPTIRGSGENRSEILIVEHGETEEHRQQIEKSVISSERDKALQCHERHKGDESRLPPKKNEKWNREFHEEHDDARDLLKARRELMEIPAYRRG